MKFLIIMFTSFGIGFSGALMPGPLLGVTIDAGFKKGATAGPIIAFGHALLELLTIIVMMLGLKEFLTKPVVSGVIGVIGGTVLFLMGLDMIKSAIKNLVSLDNTNNESDKHSVSRLILSGVIVSISNPYFTLWWATAGLACIADSLEIGLLGVVAFYIGHIMADFTWFTFVTFMISKGKRIMNDKAYRTLIFSLGFFICSISLLFIKVGVFTFL